jgi:hypothetical protein
MASPNLGGALNNVGGSVSGQLHSVHFHFTYLEKRVAVGLLLALVLRGLWRGHGRYRRYRRLRRAEVAVTQEGGRPRNWISDASE